MRCIFFSSLALLLASTTATSALADGFGSPTVGQHVYDRAGVLSQDDLGRLEGKADAVGAPTIVYIQVRQATQQQAQQDAKALMDAWNVQSANGARDGFVMLFDLSPGDTRHGQLGLYAGANWAAQLPSSELDRISTTVMRPSLSSGNLADAISAGLDATANSIHNGPAPAPPPAAPEVSSPFGPLSWLIASAWRTWFFVLFIAAFAFNVLRIIARAVGGRGSDGRYRGVQIGNSGWYFGSGGTSLWTSSPTGTDSGSSSSGASDGGSSGGTSF